MIYLPGQRLVDIKIYNETMPIRLLMTYYYFGIFVIVMDLDQGLKGWMVVGFVKYFFFCNKMSILRKKFLGDKDYSYSGSQRPSEG